MEGTSPAPHLLWLLRDLSPVDPHLPRSFWGSPGSSVSRPMCLGCWGQEGGCSQDRSHSGSGRSPGYSMAEWQGGKILLLAQRTSTLSSQRTWSKSAADLSWPPFPLLMIMVIPLAGADVKSGCAPGGIAMGSVSTTAPRGEGDWVPLLGMVEEAECREGLACRLVMRGAGKVVQIVGVLAAWEQLDSSSGLSKHHGFLSTLSRMEG